MVEFWVILFGIYLGVQIGVGLYWIFKVMAHLERKLDPVIKPEPPADKL